MTLPSETSVIQRGSGWGGPTHWSAVLDAGNTASPRAAAALEELCQTYRGPVLNYIRRRWHRPEDAEDLTQDFFARLLEKKFFKKADPEKGRFRSFLHVALKRFLFNARKRNDAEERGGGQPAVSLDETNPEGQPVDAMTPDIVFYVGWILALLEQVLTRLEGELAAAGKADLFRELKAFLTGEKPDDPYADIARRLHLTEKNLRVTVHRLRRRYQKLLREEIAKTVADPSQIEDELQSLKAALRGWTGRTGESAGQNLRSFHGHA